MNNQYFNNPPNNPNPPQELKRTADDDLKDFMGFVDPHNEETATKIKRKQGRLEVTRPKANNWVRVHPDPAYHLVVEIYRAPDDREYIVHSSVLHEFPEGTTKSIKLGLASTREGKLFLWPLNYSNFDNVWNASAEEGFMAAQESWTQIRSSREEKRYLVQTADGIKAEPQWPTESFPLIVKRAFKDRMIREDDHPLLRALRGEE